LVALLQLQKRLADALKGVGDLVFEDYRSLKDTYYTSIARTPLSFDWLPA